MKYLCKLGRTLRPQQTVTQKWQAEFVWQQVKTKQSTLNSAKRWCIVYMHQHSVLTVKMSTTQKLVQPRPLTYRINVRQIVDEVSLANINCYLSKQTLPQITSMSHIQCQWL